MEEDKFRCSRCRFEYPKAMRFGETCRWCFDERMECCGTGGGLA